jgi:hypothetical protein
MATMTSNELTQMLLKRKGSTIVSLKACTDARLRKRNNTIGDCWKLANILGMIGWDYANSINNQRAREGHTEHFEAFPRPWGKRIKGTPLVEHNGKYYLEVKVERILGEVTYVRASDGEPVTYDAISMFLPEKRINARAETKKNIYPTDYAIESIREIKIDGILYNITAE